MQPVGDRIITHHMFGQIPNYTTLTQLYHYTSSHILTHFGPPWTFCSPWTFCCSLNSHRTELLSKRLCIFICKTGFMSNLGLMSDPVSSTFINSYVHAIKMSPGCLWQYIDHGHLISRTKAEDWHTLLSASLAHGLWAYKYPFLPVLEGRGPREKIIYEWNSQAFCPGLIALNLFYEGQMHQWWKNESAMHSSNEVKTQKCHGSFRKLAV